MNSEKRQEHILKLIYYILGLNTAGFIFVISKLSSIEYDMTNYFLVFASVTLGLSICILLFLVSFTIAKIDESWSHVNTKKVRRIVGFLGSLIGLSVASVISWVLLFKGYISVSF